MTKKYVSQHWFQFRPPGNATCIVTLPMIALLTSSVDIEMLSSSARVTSVKSAEVCVLGSSGCRQQRPQFHKIFLQRFVVLLQAKSVCKGNLQLQNWVNFQTFPKQPLTHLSFCKNMMQISGKKFMFAFFTNLSLIKYKHQCERKSAAYFFTISVPKSMGLNYLRSK